MVYCTESRCMAFVHYKFSSAFLKERFYIMLKKILCAAAAAIMFASAGCDNKEELPEPPVNPDYSPSESSQTDIGEPVTEETPVSDGINPLTGESGYNAAAAGKRPVAVMVNNLKAALPQYGIEQADIIYELPVEGGITRMMAVYADYTSVPDVCSVRSCRYYYPLICLGMDAFYCHWGSDQTIALDTLNRTGIDHLDGASESGLFYRDEERLGTYASEHTGYLRGSELAAKIEEKGFRTERNAQNAGAYFNFAPEGEKAVPAEMTANSAVLSFSGEYYSTFEYDPLTGEYMKFHSGNPHVDGRTGSQLAFDNVFVLQTDIHTREDGYLMDVALSGGTGYYISNGGAQNITWTKTSEDAPIKMFASDGSELAVNVGESYIGIIGNDKPVTIS